MVPTGRYQRIKAVLLLFQILGCPTESTGFHLQGSRPSFYRIKPRIRSVGGYTFAEGDQYEDPLDEVMALGGDSWFLDSTDEESPSETYDDGDDLTETEVLSLGGDPFFLTTQDKAIEEKKKKKEEEEEETTPICIQDESVPMDNRSKPLDSTSILSFIGSLSQEDRNGEDSKSDGANKDESPNTSVAEIMALSTISENELETTQSLEEKVASLSNGSSDDNDALNEDELLRLGGDPFFLPSGLNEAEIETETETDTESMTHEGNNDPFFSPKIGSGKDDSDSIKEPLNATLILSSLQNPTEGLGEMVDKQILMVETSNAQINHNPNGFSETLADKNLSKNEDYHDDEDWEWDGQIDEDAHMGFE